MVEEFVEEFVGLGEERTPVAIKYQLGPVTAEWVGGSHKSLDTGGGNWKLSFTGDGAGYVSAESFYVSGSAAEIIPVMMELAVYVEHALRSHQVFLDARKSLTEFVALRDQDFERGNDSEDSDEGDQG